MLISQKIDKGTYFTPFPSTKPEQVEKLIRITRDSLRKEFEKTHILKKARQRLVVRIEAEDSPIIFKLFPLQKITSRLRHKKFARREFLNYLKASELEILTPACFGLIEQRKFGLVYRSGIILNDISNASNALNMSQSTPYELAAEKCLPALSLLYNKGAHHLDAREENILLTEKEWFIIDWQYAKFVSPREEWLLEHLAAFFIKKAPNPEQESLTGNWLKKLHASSDHHLDFELFHSRVLLLLLKHQGMRARKNLRPC